MPLCLLPQPSLLMEIWQLWMCFVFPASVWDVRWQKLMSSDMQIATMMARLRRAWEPKQKKKKKLVFTRLLLSHICVCMLYMLFKTLSFFVVVSFFFHSICFLRIPEVFLLGGGMYLGGQGQRPCEEDRYPGNMNLRLSDRPKWGEESDVVRMCATQPLHCNLTHTYSGFAPCVRACVCTPSLHAVSWLSGQCTARSAEIFMPFVVLGVGPLCWDSTLPLLWCFSVQPNHSPCFVMKGFLAVWSFRCKNMICF